MGELFGRNYKNHKTNIQHSQLVESALTKLFKGKTTKNLTMTEVREFVYDLLKNFKRK